VSTAGRATGAQRPLLRATPSSTATSTAALDAALAALPGLKAKGAPQEEIDAAIEHVSQLAKDAGANRVDFAINDGEFSGVTLSGRMVRMLGGDAPIPLGALSFNLYAPADLLVRPTGGGSDAAAVFKGPKFGRENTYVISTPLRLEEAGAAGVSHAIATYHPVADRPERLEVRFAALRLEPAAGGSDGDDASLAAWLGALRAANPGMDPATGVLEVAMPAGVAPPGWMDYLAMTPKYQLVRGNAGSVTLLVRK
jgi:hypothetical protein